MSVEVLGIGTYKLELYGGRTLLLHDIFFTMDIRRNLLSAIAMLGLSFKFAFESKNIDIFLKTTY